MNDAAFNELIARAKAGDAEAMPDLLRGFESDVRIAVRRRLPRALRTQFDSMDFVQAVWASVLMDGEADLGRFESPRHLRAYLAAVARNKVLQEYRRRTQTRRYNLNREEPLYVRRGDREEPREVASSDPTPSQNLQADDRMEQLTAGRDARESEVLRLRSEGLTFEEIAQRTGMHERSARRLIEGIRERMEARQWR